MTNTRVPETSKSRSDTRLFGNYGSRQLSPITLGSQVSAVLTGTSATTLVATASSMKVTSGGTLKRIDGGAAGDLLVLSASPSLTVDESDNIRLNGTSVPLDNAQDTLTLVYDGALWLAVAFSNNA